MPKTVNLTKYDPRRTIAGLLDDIAECLAHVENTGEVWSEREPEHALLAIGKAESIGNRVHIVLKELARTLGWQMQHVEEARRCEARRGGKTKPMARRLRLVKTDGA